MEKEEQALKTCFVIMPISDVATYETGHFQRVYNFLIKPACKIAGFKTIRADEVQATNYIVVDILKKILEADLVLCDLSSRNPNVMYELGIRQAFNLPVTLIRDSKTPRIFDIQGLRDIEYDESLRVDKINIAIESLATTIQNTSTLDASEVNSIIQLLGTPRMGEDQLYKKIEETIKSSLLSSELVNKLVDTVAQGTNVRTEKQVSDILDSAAGAAARKVKENSFLTIDSTPLLLEQGKVWDEPINASQSVLSFLDTLWFKLRPHVPPHTHGDIWILRNQKSGHIYKEITKYWAAEHGIDREEQTLEDVQIVAGMTLEIIPLKEPIIKTWAAESLKRLLR